MAETLEGLRYSEEHEWVKSTDAENEVLVGITDYAQAELGDVVFVELPQAGERYDRMEVFGTIEAVKAVSELYCPVAGEVTETNGALDEDPGVVNTDPYGEGWMIRVRMQDPSQLDELLSASAYRALIEGDG
ncbi:MAG: glycine cleavage system protein GcvH [Gemmatimonadota bacterium]